MTFDPHPVAVVAGSGPPLLCSVAERLELLREAGAYRVEVLPFTRELAVLPPEVFHQAWIVERLGASAVVVGDNFRFGHRAAGDVQMLSELNAAAGIATVVVPLELAGGEPVSSSRIRRLLVDDGDVESAERLLGRPLRLEGPVVAGARRGRELGVPTANLAIDPALVVPLDGVYAARAHVPEIGGHDAAVSIGTNPQFHDDSDGNPRTVEAHLIGYDGPDFYDAHCTITFVQRLRGQAVFASVDALVEQMQLDLVRAREAVRAAAQSGA